MERDWITRIPGLDCLSDVEQAQLRQHCNRLQLPKDAQVFHPGAPCQSYFLVLAGSIRVQMLADTGREIVLYRVTAGGSCVLTTAGLLGHSPYSASGHTETETEAIALPGTLFHRLLGTSETFRTFVFEGFGERIANILQTMESAIFHRMDARLARALLDHAEGKSLHLTHQDLAIELGTAREVISRLLKGFERDGLVHLSRGVITLANPALLSLRAEKT